MTQWNAQWYRNYQLINHLTFVSKENGNKHFIFFFTLNIIKSKAFCLCLDKKTKKSATKDRMFKFLSWKTQVFKTRTVRFTAKVLQWPFRTNVPFQSKMWYGEEPLLLRCYKRRTYVKICSPLPAMVTFLNGWNHRYLDRILTIRRKSQDNKQSYEWKVLESDIKHTNTHRNRQTKNIINCDTWQLLSKRLLNGIFPVNISCIADNRLICLDGVVQLDRTKKWLDTNFKPFAQFMLKIT